MGEVALPGGVSSEMMATTSTAIDAFIASPTAPLSAEYQQQVAHFNAALVNITTDQTLLCLAHLCRYSTNMAARNEAVVALRRLSIQKTGEPPQMAILSLSTDQLANVRALLLAGLLEVTTETAAERRPTQPYIDAVATYAIICSNENRLWPQLAPLVMDLIRTENDVARLVGTHLLAAVVSDQAMAFGPHMMSLAPLLISFMDTSQSIALRVSSAKCVCSLITPSESNPANTLFVDMMTAVFQIQRDSSVDAIPLCVRLTKAIVDLLEEGFQPTLPIEALFLAQCEIIAKPTSTTALRQECLNLMLNLAEASPKVVKKSPRMIKGGVEICLLMMSSYTEPEDTWINSTKDDTSATDEESVDAGSEGLDRFCAIVGPKSGAAVLPALSALAREEKWEFRAAAMHGFSLVAEHIDFNDLPIKQIVSFLSDSNPRVRHNAIRAVAQTASDHTPDFQQRYHKLVLPALIKALDDPITRLQSYAAAAIFNFLSDLDQDDDEDDTQPAIPITEYYDVLMTKLMALLRSAPNHVKNQVLTAFAVCSAVAPKEFIKYYDTLIPMIKAVVAHATTPELSSLRCRAMESLTYIGLKCKDKFKGDVSEVMALLLDILRSGHTKIGDAAHQYVLQACTRICNIVGKDFAPVLPLVMPSILESVRSDPDFANIDLSGSEKKIDITVSTKLLEEKTVACSLISSFVNDLGDVFAPYFEEVAAIMLPLMDYDFSDEIKDYALGVLPDLIKVGVEAVASNKLEAKVVRSVSQTMIDAVSNRLREQVGNPEATQISQLVETLGQMFVSCGDMINDIFSEDAMLMVTDHLLRITGMIVARIENRLGGGHDSDDEEDEANGEMEDDEQMYMISGMFENMAKSFKERFARAWTTLLRAPVMTMMQKSSNPLVMRTGIYVFCDLMCNLPAGTMVDSLPIAVPIMLGCLTSENTEHRQSSAYGLGICAKQCGTAFAPFVNETVERLVALITHPESRDDEYSHSTDNAISSLVHVALHQNRPDLLASWLSYLPLSGDTAEAEVCYTILCDLVESNNVHLLGANFSNLPRILSVICDVIDNSSMCKPGVRARLVVITKRLGTLPAEALQALSAALSPQQRATFTKVLTE